MICFKTKYDLKRNKRQLIFKTHFIVVLFYLVSILPILAVKRPNPTKSQCFNVLFLRGLRGLRGLEGLEGHEGLENTIEHY